MNTTTSINRPLIKYSRIEGKKLILVPTAEGLEYFKHNPDKQLMVAEKIPQGIRFTETTETIGGVSVNALEVELDSGILNYRNDQNTTLNYFKAQVFTVGQITYFLQIPYTLNGK